MNMKTVINAICHHGFTEIAMEDLKDQKLSTFDLKTIMNEACLHGDLNLVEWLWHSADDSLFDMKTAMLKVCRSRGDDSISVLKWLWENVNRDLFDMAVAMDNACAYGKTEIVEWLWINTNTETYQIQNALLKACESDQVSTVDWLTTNVPEHLLDLPNALQTACSSSKCNSANIVEVLAKHADTSKLDIDSLIRTACKCCKPDIVRYLINCTDIITTDYKNTLNSVLSIDINKVENNKSVNQGKQDLVLLILQKADPSNINIESAIVEACKHDWLDVMKHIWLNISHKYFEMNAAKIKIACEYGSVGIIQWSLGSISLECIDINTLMIESCGYGWLNIVKRVWNHEQISHDKLDMKTAMSDACTYNRFEIVTWLLKNTDDQTFDTSYVLVESCRNGWTDIVENIAQNGDSMFNNMTVTAGITEACANGHLPVIDFMYRTFGTELFDLETISKQRTKASENEDVTMFFLRNFNCNSFDISTVLKRACSFGWTRVVKWIINELEYDGDLVEPLNNACVNGEAEIVKYILQNISQEKLDLKSAMLCACNKGWDEIVALLIQKVDHQKLNVRNAVIEACRCEDSDCVILIIRQVDHKFIDLNAVLIEICKNLAREQLVLSILKTVDGSEFDRDILEETAKKK
ncbi:unnamed protein product [Mytilus edulis]|uniref:Ankyrin repeat protein n=1 Tax=Mytilus edulis TaxID=6550 RepID=A0A8S3Q6M0_MYTED|nr:unnamed protein product [Mytilus edulis]